MNESTEIAVKYAVAMMGLLMIVFVIALLTPVVAKCITRIIEKTAFKGYEKNDDIYKVRGIYDPSYISSHDSENNNNGDENNGKEQ